MNFKILQGNFGSKALAPLHFGQIKSRNAHRRTPNIINKI